MSPIKESAMRISQLAVLLLLIMAAAACDSNKPRVTVDKDTGGSDITVTGDADLETDSDLLIDPDEDQPGNPDTPATDDSATEGTETPEGKDGDTPDKPDVQNDKDTDNTKDVDIAPDTDTPVVPECGNSKPEEGEECDDGNANNTDGCTTECKANICSDGYVYTGVETCEVNDTATCTSVLGTTATGNVSCKQDCSGWVTANNCTRSYTCPAKPATGTVWNNVSSYTQTWDGTTWTPADDTTTEYNTTGSDKACQYKCAEHYTWNGTACAADSRTFTCAQKPANSNWNTVSGYTQTWDGSKWAPADTTTAYNETASDTACRFTCITDYLWNGTACVGPARMYTCPAKPTTGTEWNTVSKYIQVWDGSKWDPADDTTTEYSETGSDKACQYKCAENYVWNGTICAAATRTYQCPAKPVGTVWNTVDSYTQTWDGAQWMPLDTQPTYNTTGSKYECRYKCATNYTWDDTQKLCKADTRINACPAKPKHALWNSVSEFTQTWNGTTWQPTADTTTEYNTVADTQTCRYVCDARYYWNGTACAYGWEHVAAGGAPTCAIGNGKLYCWGMNDFGQVGLGYRSSSEMVSYPHQVGTRTDWEKIAVSIDGDFACGIANGELYCWGRNNFGKLGIGSTVDKYLPTRVGPRTDWTDVSLGEDHACGVASGELYCWGRDYYGQLGLETTTEDQLIPIRVGTRADWAQISAVFDYSCGIAAGSLYCWGRNRNGVLGLDNLDNKNTPTLVNTRTDWTYIDTGAFHNCGIANSELYCWGYNGYGQLGDGNSGNYSEMSPIRVGAAISWSVISTGGSHTCGLTTTDTLYCWGSNTYGQLGIGTSGSDTNKSTPTFVGTADEIAAASGHTCSISKGVLFCWGSNSVNQLGDGTTVNKTSPSATEILEWDFVTTGDQHACGIMHGQLYCWGFNDYGQLGIGSTVNTNTPTKVGTRNDWEEISAGGIHTCGIAAGILYCWGDYKKSPVRVTERTDWEHITAGGNHTCGIASGSLYCWGQDNYGQLGNGSYSGDLSPIRIGARTDWQYISAGRYYTCGIAAGSLYCWGNNAENQLGDGTTTQRNEPVKIGTINTWELVTAGIYRTCGITAGKLYCWGKNSDGLLGDGTTNPALVPTRIGTRTDWETISSSKLEDYYYGLCGVANGEMLCWGFYTYASPQRIGTSDTWVMAGAGGDFSCGILNYDVYCWGHNTYGQLGDGTNTTQDEPAITVYPQ